MAFIRGLIGLVAAILFTIFAVANRHSVELVWSPAHPHAQVPLYAIALGLLAIGFVLGSFMTWLNTLPVRWEKRRQKRQISKLELELNTVKKADETVATESWPALPAAVDKDAQKTAL